MPKKDGRIANLTVGAEALTGGFGPVVAMRAVTVGSSKTLHVPAMGTGEPAPRCASWRNAWRGRCQAVTIPVGELGSYRMCSNCRPPVAGVRSYSQFLPCEGLAFSRLMHWWVSVVSLTGRALLDPTVQVTTLHALVELMVDLSAYLEPEDGEWADAAHQLATEAISLLKPEHATVEADGSAITASRLATASVLVALLPPFGIDPTRLGRVQQLVAEAPEGALATAFLAEYRMPVLDRPLSHFARITPADMATSGGTPLEQLASGWEPFLRRSVASAVAAHEAAAAKAASRGPVPVAFAMTQNEVEETCHGTAPISGWWTWLSARTGASHRVVPVLTAVAAALESTPSRYLCVPGTSDGVMVARGHASVAELLGGDGGMKVGGVLVGEPDDRDAVFHHLAQIRADDTIDVRSSEALRLARALAASA